MQSFNGPSLTLDGGQDSTDHKEKQETLEEIKGYVREPEKHEAKLEAGKRYCQQHGMIYSLIFEEGLEVSS